MTQQQVDAILAIKTRMAENAANKEEFDRLFDEFQVLADNCDHKSPTGEVYLGGSLFVPRCNVCGTLLSEP